MNFQAYHESDVRNFQLHLKAPELLEDGFLTPPQYEQVKTAFPVELRQGNIFVRIGLFLFTGLCILFSILFVSWIIGVLDSGQRGLGGLLLFFAVALTALNEYLIRKRHWYRQGSDNALCYASIICLVIGVGLVSKFDDPLDFSVFFLVFSSLAAVRYGDPIAALGAFYTLLFSFILAYDSNGLPMIHLPFVGVILSLTVYFFAKTALKNVSWFYWEDCFKVLEIVGLVAFYGSINYFVVDKLLDRDPETGIPSPYNYIFTFLTMFVPLFYLMAGIQTKDRILWILGGLGIVASILTFRYYHAIMPIEWALTLAGLALLVLAFLLIHYLKTPRKNFAYQPERGKSSLIETLIVNQFLPQTAANKDTIPFGGGDFGGGGASEGY